MSNGQVIEWIIANPQWWCCAPVLLILVVRVISRIGAGDRERKRQKAIEAAKAKFAEDIQAGRRSYPEPSKGPTINELRDEARRMGWPLE